MEKVIRYRCGYCGSLYSGEEECLKHEDKHRKAKKANEMLKDGATIQEIQAECHIWSEVPEHLKGVTQDNCFTIPYLQCCDRPAYQIVDIDIDGNVNVRGCGSWSGYYGNYMKITSTNLRNPRPKEELFVDPRYSTRW